VVPELIELGHAAVDPHVGGDNADGEAHALPVAEVRIRTVDGPCGEDDELPGTHLHMRDVLVVRIPVFVDLDVVVVITEE
jgi:hypothetical protein